MWSSTVRPDHTQSIIVHEEMVSASAYRAGAVLEKPTLSVGSVSIISIAAGTKSGVRTVLITIA